MIIKTRGIVFRAIKYRETSLITEIYTESKGLQKYIINGVRSPKGRAKASLLQVMSLLDLVAYCREDRELNRINEIHPAHIYNSIPFNIKKGAVGLFMAEIAHKSIKESESNPVLFNFLFNSFRFLDETTDSIANLHLCYLIKLSRLLGFEPGGQCSQETPVFDLRAGIYVEKAPAFGPFIDHERSSFLYALQQIPLEYTAEINMPNNVRRGLLRQLIDFYRLHIENMPPVNSHEILQEVLGGK